ncbi:carbohydrate porin OprB [soil metagenome]
MTLFAKPTACRPRRTLAGLAALLLAGGTAHAQTPVAPTAPTVSGVPTATIAPPAPATASPSAFPAVPPSGPWLLGDWGGLRTRLYQQGVDFQLGYTTESAYNVIGGTKSLVDYTHQVAVGATMDLEKLIGLPSTVFQVTWTERAGRNLSEDAGLNTLMLVQEVYGRGQTVRLTRMWLEHQAFGGYLALKVGRMSVGEDFADFPCDFQNLTFCGSAPGNLVGGYIYNWPISQWGGRAKLKLDGFGYVSAAAYDQNDQYLSYTDKVLPVWYPGSTGVLVPVELAWLPKFDGGRLAGSYKVGAWYSSSSAKDVALDVNGNLSALTGQSALTHRGLYGGYLTFQQQLTRNGTDNPNGGLWMFANAVAGDNTTSVTDRQFAAGFTYTGPFSARPNDVFGFAAGTTHVNNRVTNMQNIANAMGVPGVNDSITEFLFELYYTVAVVPGVNLRPNVQYISRPGGSNATRDIMVLGLKTTMSF